ncbi:hypothetical protein PAPYR_2499 [Paratrimastix pyriformis]|uniref:Uncharacterized protein n=1 Tax=Paratrimastix pyriformis TaxID=342808 RepID=A0ABQ8USJ4_9EUKA|nr:hypothetical protein PAPYR_2499 [Paratrimastix pyriformis]
MQSVAKTIETSGRPMGGYRPDPGRPLNIHTDPRVIRGSTYIHQKIEPAPAPPKMRSPATPPSVAFPRKKPTAREIAAAAAPPPEEELYEIIPGEPLVPTPLPRPPTPIEQPEPYGIDEEVQVEPDELFDFDVEVRPLLEVTLPPSPPPPHVVSSTPVSHTPGILVLTLEQSVHSVHELQEADFETIKVQRHQHHPICITPPSASPTICITPAPSAIFTPICITPPSASPRPSAIFTPHLHHPTICITPAPSAIFTPICITPLHGV